MPSQELIRYPQLRERFGIPYTKEHIDRLSKVGKFPRKIKLSYRCVAWLAADIDEWIAERAAEREQTRPPVPAPEAA